MLQGNDARRAPFFGDFILEENLDRFVEAICVNQPLSHGMASSTQTATMRKGRLDIRRPYVKQCQLPRGDGAILARGPV